MLGRNLLTIAPAHRRLAAIGLFVLSGILVDVLLGGGKFGPDDVALTASVVAAFAISIPFDALAYPLSRGLYATHDTIRQVHLVVRRPGRRHRRLAGARGPARDPRDPARAMRPGMAAKDALLAMFLVGSRLRRIGQPEATARCRVGTTEMYRSSRSV